jgi:hypothetical protein
VNVLLYQLDGKLPNIALMRLSQFHRERGAEVRLRWVRSVEDVGPELFDEPDRVYGSAIFEKSRPLAEALLATYPSAIVGGTGWELGKTLEDIGIHGLAQDYSIYPDFTASIGFSQRGCRLRCPFCVVPKKEGKVRDEQSIEEIWRGDPWPRHIILLDNDFFGQPRWREKMTELREGGFRVSFNQGINVRLVDEEIAEALAGVDYRCSKLERRALYCAWDNRKDEKRLFRGLNLLVEAGVKPSHLMVYILIGYWPGETHEDRDYRRAKLREFGAVPYPMPFTRDPELVGFQRWVVTAADKYVGWDEFVRAKYRPEACSVATDKDTRQSGGRMNRIGWLQLDDWAGRTQHQILVVRETPKRYEITAVSDGTRLGGRRRSLQAGERALVPKRAITFRLLENIAIIGDRPTDTDFESRGDSTQ